MQQTSLKRLLKTWILLEATRFKREMGENLPRWKEKLIEYEEAGGYYVHFSTVPRIGLFIKNRFGTPIGFYAYPLDKTKISEFATEREYAVVFKPKPEARLLDIGSYTEEDLERDLVKLQGLGLSRERMLDSARKARHQIPGGQLWNITREGSQADQYKKYLGTIEGDYRGDLTRGGGPTGTWTMLLKKLGYDGVVDNGNGIVHHAEPSQAVFFSTTKLEMVEVIDKAKDEPVKLETFSRDYSRRDLSGKDFSGKKLESAIFRDAVLVGTRFTEAMLVKANFYSTNMEKAVFHRAKLGEAALDQADATETDFTEADLRHISAESATFVRANFSNADMKGAIGRYANFSGAVLTGADMTRADLSATNLNNAVLDGAKLTRTRLSDALLQNASLKGVDLGGASLWGTDLRGADLTGATNLLSAKMSDAKYNPSTKFPEGFDPKEAAMELVD